MTEDMAPVVICYTPGSIPDSLRGDKHFEWFLFNSTRQVGTFEIESEEVTFHLIQQSGMPDLPWFLGYVLLPEGERFVFLSDAIPEEFRPFMAWHEARCTARENPDCVHACLAVMEREFMLAGTHLADLDRYDEYVIKRVEYFQILVAYFQTNSDLYAASLPAAKHALNGLLYFLAEAQEQLHPI